MSNRELQYFYVRNQKELLSFSFGLSPRGGDTYCVKVPTGTTLIDYFNKYLINQNVQMSLDIGVSTCHPKDPFIKKMGREIAQSRMSSEVFNISSVSFVGDQVTFFLKSEKYEIVLTTLLSKKDIVETRMNRMYIL